MGAWQDAEAAILRATDALRMATHKFIAAWFVAYGLVACSREGVKTSGQGLECGSEGTSLL